MKKSLIALAVLAASGAAMAQSTVTLYGVADAWVGTQKDTGATIPTNGATGAERERQTRLGSGGYNGSRFGLMGTEDLGGGLKANFVLEQGFNIDTAAPVGSQQFSRQAFLGLSGGFGTVRLGRQYTAYDELRGATNNSFDTAFATTGTVFSYGIADYTGREDNQIYYASPVVSGFSGAVGFALGENKTATTNSFDTTSLHVKYAAGPLLVGLAYQNEELTNTTDRSYTLLAGSYNFGIATVTAGFNRAKEDGEGKDNEYQLGVAVPVSANSQIALGYSHAKLKDTAGVNDGKATGYSLTGYYDLSKRTRLYAGFSESTAKDAAGVKERETSLFAVGVRHRF